MAWSLPFKFISIFIISLVLTNSFSFSEPISCGPDPCLCTVSEDKFLNFTDIQATMTLGNLTFYFNGCKNVKTNCSDSSFYFVNQTTSPSNCTNLGDRSTMKVVNSQITKHYELEFSLKNSMSRIILICTMDFGYHILTEYNISDIRHPVFYLFSEKSCVHSIPPPHGLSTGGMLIVLLLVGFIVYFIGGALVLYCVRGARGKEMIPNIDFWQNLPGLIKDGVIFILGGCRPTAVTTAESYDRI